MGKSKRRGRAISRSATGLCLTEASCVNCGQAFLKTVWNKQTCSRACAHGAMMTKRRCQEKTCPHCNALYMGAKSQKFCSKRCGRLANSKSIVSRGRSGFREDLGYFVRSSLEADYARMLISKGVKYEYEPVAIRLANGTTYTPDFLLLNTKVYVELKGWKGQDKDKLKAAKHILRNRLAVLYYHQVIELLEEVPPPSGMEYELLSDSPYRAFKTFERTCPECKQPFQAPAARPHQYSRCSRACANVERFRVRRPGKIEAKEKELRSLEELHRHGVASEGQVRKIYRIRMALKHLRSKP